MIDLNSIRYASIFDGLTEPEIREIANIAQEKRVQKGGRLFSRGDKADTLYIVKTGRFALTIGVRVFEAHDEIAIEEKVAGDALGWSALVDPFESFYSAYCTLDGSVAALPRGAFEALLASDAHLGFRFSRNLSQLIGSRFRALQDLWLEEVEQTKARVDYWTHTRLSGDLNSMIRTTHKHTYWRFPTRH